MSLDKSNGDAKEKIEFGFIAPIGSSDVITQPLFCWDKNHINVKPLKNKQGPIRPHKMIRIAGFGTIVKMVDNE